MKTALLIALITFASCNQCKRLQRIALKNPDCLKAITTDFSYSDTFTLYDTVIIPETMLQVITERDTIINTKTMYFEKKGNTYTTICKTDTLYRDKEIIRNKIIKLPQYVIQQPVFYKK
jgi:hypothetical protein